MIKETSQLKIFSKNKIEDYGKDLSYYGPFMLNNSMFPLPYYLRGVSEIDSFFNNEKYYKQGYFSMLYTSENSFCILFGKISDGQTIGGLHIFREDIIEYKTEQAQQLEFVKHSRFKSATKFAMRGAGLSGLVGRDLIKKMNISTEVASGWIMNLSYYDQNSQIATMEIYVQEKYFQDTSVFLNTYYKKELPKEALKSKMGNSNCFIATATYQDIFSPEVVLFRKFRDDILLKNWFGTFFVQCYYKTSPKISRYLFRKKTLNTISKYVLDILYKTIKKRLN